MESSNLPVQKKARAIIVGAGLGGLSAAIALTLTNMYSVTVLEAAPVLREIGAGIQISPNASRLLIRWGCSHYLQDKAVEPKFVRILRWQNDHVLQQREMNPLVESRFGAPYWQVHRADLHQALLQRCRDLGSDIRTNSKVAHVEIGDCPRVVLDGGEAFQCDFLIGADGINSTVRQAVIPNCPDPQATGDLAYRFTVSMSLLTLDPALAALATVPGACIWWGPGKHVVGYPLRGSTIYNVVVIFPDDGSVVKGSRAPGTLKQMETLFEGWSPMVSKLLRLADPTGLTKWTLMDLPPLATWIRGRTALLGDACHPMLPYLAQGSAQALEDAAALAQCLSGLPEDLEQAAKTYSSIRYSRATKIQQFSRAQRGRNHLPDGPEQAERDAAMEGKSNDRAQGIAWTWDADGSGPPKEWTEGLFGYDAEDESRNVLRELRSNL